MIRELRGNLLSDDADALVNTVNTVGVMGKGIALQFKRAYPDMFKNYAREAKNGRLETGRMHVWETSGLTGPRFIINFPTKRHWKGGSRIEDIGAGLDDLVRVVQEHGITSVAVPPLGCGNGGLDWADVAPLMHAALQPLATTVDIRLYVPAGAPAASDMVNRETAPALTPTRAALLRLMNAYREVAWEWPGLVDTQKLAYFLQEAGEPLRLTFVKGPYGPYADDLRKTLRQMGGHFITGFGDGSARPWDAEPLQVMDESREALSDVVASSPETAARTVRVLELVSGFEGTYDIELLASVHWAAVHADARTPDEASRVIRLWTKRKAELFSSAHVGTAWNALMRHGWICEAAVV
ncbi:type II toxin-antitoxin system antitoxin DNA ADP-ribosyl glycohydrolase DarG [Mobilicoccus massiliensis]|uniref:type II toxin-antitoxin system antitoxin DNA ADP-ribosyl glycohydrolase DarG n=1 Tax=Mobilicoccus massiliensis TaxID=1522310 RepID=UPI00058E61E7|nr:macro domain-containing protein [Mobilicoccus massiliensis]